MQTSDQILKGLLKISGIPEKASYTRAEVCSILGISTRTFWTMTCDYEPSSDGTPSHPATLDSYMLRGHRRVPFHELADFLTRNRTYDRRNALHPDQKLLPFDPSDDPSNIS